MTLLLAALLAAPVFAAEPKTPPEIRAYFASAAHKKSHPTGASFIDDVYRVILHRDPDEKGRRDWLAALKRLGRARVVEGFLKSREYLALTAPKPKLATPKESRAYFRSPPYKKLERSDEGFLYDLYTLLLGRLPDEKGFKDWLKAMRTGKRLSRQQVVERFLRSDEYLKTHPRAKPPSPEPEPSPTDKTRNAANSIFDQPGLFVDQAANCTAEACGPASAERYYAAGLRWIAVQIHNNGERKDNAARFNGGWADGWRKAGFKVGFWGVSYGKGQAAADAKLGADLTADYKADLYIANCEAAFKIESEGGDPAENWAFVESFKARAAERGTSGVARALSNMGRTSMDFAPWIKNGWDTLPQAYWNEHLVYQPSLCCKFYKDWGWPPGRIHPTIATYAGHGDQTRTITIADYAADLKACGTRGYSYYLPESYLTAEQLGQLGSMR